MTEFSPSPSEPPQTVLATDSALRAVQQRRPASSHTMTIEELATQVGMTVRNIRAYNSAGLLPPPTLRGRLGLYGEEHLAQLQAIRMLRNQGLSLERIKAVVEQNNRNEASGAWNKLGDLARVLSWHIPVDQEALRLPLSTIEATWRADFTPAQTEQLVRSGLQRILPDGSIEYLTPGLRAVAQQLSDMGVPLDDALEMQEAVSRDLRRLVRSSLRTVLQEAGRRPEADQDEQVQRLLQSAPLLLLEAVQAMLPVILQQEAEHLAENLQPLAAGMAANASRDETSGQSDAA
ncbi:MerR family transcriptional regulator [Brachymonas denitrificans]|jgi:DNA-binding transcriptional MerR regulator|uniref:MerR HTH family regulatory protein n=1 Tax=Brachymonas denitrificans DSM 15123 TaxID=1121117 RepID=A0A1H8IL95_9BURK|nr:MerR family transcriptional regulator [Brachymonas denitrificans]SEN69201.1 MerR HTH family regulatory protein [Brachymonas denitrificans DSM 15123]